LYGFYEYLILCIISPLQFIAYEVLYSCSFVEVGKVRQHFDYGVKCMPDHVWPLIKENDADFVRIPGHIRRLAGASLQMSSNISCIKLFRKHSSTMDDSSNIQKALYPFKF
jgi:hypothetical protein